MQTYFRESITYLRLKKHEMNKGKELSYSIIRKFHPFALLISLGIFFLVLINLNGETPLIEKLVFLLLAGSIYFIAITFETWRIDQQ